jgi:hypothetical protein
MSGGRVNDLDFESVSGGKEQESLGQNQKTDLSRILEMRKKKGRTERSR